VDSSNSSRDSPRNMFQVFQTSSKYNLTSSIQWYNWISDIPYCSPKNPKKLIFYYRNFWLIIVIPAGIRLGTCYKCSKRVPSTTRRALSNGIIGFPILSTIASQNLENRLKSAFLLVIPAGIRLGTCSKCSKWVPSTTRWALSNGIIGFPILSTIVSQNLENRLKSAFLLVIPAGIRLGTCSKCSKRVPSTTRWALSNGIIGFSILPTIVPKIPKNWYFTIEIFDLL